MATIVPTAASLVYGVLWQLDQQQIQRLDDYEGVADGLYGYGLYLSVETAEKYRATGVHV